MAKMILNLVTTKPALDQLCILEIDFLSFVRAGQTSPDEMLHHLENMLPVGYGLSHDERAKLPGWLNQLKRSTSDMNPVTLQVIARDDTAKAATTQEAPCIVSDETLQAELYRATDHCKVLQKQLDACQSLQKHSKEEAVQWKELNTSLSKKNQ